VRAPVLEQEEVAAATQASRNLGKYNRDIGQKIGAGAPFDAPFKDTFATSDSSLPAGHGSGRRAGMPPAMPTPALADSVAEAKAEAAANRTRMRGCEDLLGGYLVPGQQGQQPRRNGMPPRPAQELLPQAMMKLQYDGGSISNLTASRSEYHNSKVLAEANRDRNTAERIFG